MADHFLTLALEAVMDGQPDKPIEIAPGTWVRAEAIARMLSPEGLRRGKARIAQERLMADIGAAS